MMPVVILGIMSQQTETLLSLRVKTISEGKITYATLLK
jgi:hypothetical protein